MMKVKVQAAMPGRMVKHNTTDGMTGFLKPNSRNLQKIEKKKKKKAPHTDSYQNWKATFFTIKVKLSLLCLHRK